MNDPGSLIENALSKGRRALDEYDAKLFLSAFGIPVCLEAQAADVDAAAARAAGIGFPVVLKASGEKLTHKTEVDAVVLNVKNEDEIRTEGKRLLAIAGCETLLVQEMVAGARELVCGLSRDPSFGPSVMFGLGGVLTETLRDTVFRIAPLGRYDALDMMAGIRAKKILEAFRGEAAADTDLLARILIAVGNIGLKFDAIAEIDINPLKIRRDGKPVAVDALIVLNSGSSG